MTYLKNGDSDLEKELYDSLDFYQRAQEDSELEKFIVHEFIKLQKEEATEDEL